MWQRSRGTTGAVRSQRESPSRPLRAALLAGAAAAAVLLAASCSDTSAGDAAVYDETGDASASFREFVDLAELAAASDIVVRGTTTPTGEVTAFPDGPYKLRHYELSVTDVYAKEKEIGEVARSLDLCVLFVEPDAVEVERLQQEGLPGENALEPQVAILREGDDNLFLLRDHEPVPGVRCWGTVAGRTGVMDPAGGEWRMRTPLLNGQERFSDAEVRDVTVRSIDGPEAPRRSSISPEGPVAVGSTVEIFVPVAAEPGAEVITGICAAEDSLAIESCDKSTAVSGTAGTDLSYHGFLLVPHTITVRGETVDCTMPGACTYVVAEAANLLHHTTFPVEAVSGDGNHGS